MHIYLDLQIHVIVCVLCTLHNDNTVTDLTGPLLQVVDLSHDVRKIKALTGDSGEHFNRIVTEIETLGHGCGDTCGRVEDELRRLKNYTRSALDRVQTHIKTLQGGGGGGGGSCSQACSALQEEVGQLRQDVEKCTRQCKNGLDTSAGWSIHIHPSIHPSIHS